MSERIYVEDPTTLRRTVKEDVADRIELEIGDSKQVEAYPQAKIARWDNEVNLSVRRDNGARSFTRVGDQVRFESATEDIVIYELDGFEDGGLEIELHLKERPKSNVFDFSIETKGLNFFYQGELTAEELERGDSRPDNVVGSYAVYHATKKNNVVGGKAYKTGKFAHIYRPHVVDADGNETWADLNIDVESKKLTVTVPQVFLAKATYPVVVDPTIGYTSIGSGRHNIFVTSFLESYRRGLVTASTPPGEIVSFSAALSTFSASDGDTFDVVAALYSFESNGANSHGLVDSFSGNLTYNSVQEWYTITPPTNASFVSGQKIVFLYGDYTSYVGSGTSIAIHYDSGTGVEYYDWNPSPVYPSPLTLAPSGWTDQNSMYFTYNPFLYISTEELPDAAVNTLYSETVTASSGTSPYTYSIISGTLPTGLSLNTSTGEISGTPTVIETQTFTIQVTDNVLDTATKELSIVVAGLPPTVSTNSSTLITDTTATLNGNITNTGGPSVTKRGFVYDTTSRANPPVTSLLTTDTFESDFGNWVNVIGDDFNWTRDSGGTPSSSTGPSTGNGGSTWYVYIETSGPSAGAEAWLEYDLGVTKSGYVDFYYHMYGSSMGSLRLEGWDGSTWTEIWSLSGDQGNSWYNATTPATNFVGYSKLRFVGVCGTSFRGDVALDDISVYESTTAPAPASTSYANYVEETGTYSTGTYSIGATSLTPSTTYYVRAYAYNSEGYSYADTEVSFTTTAAGVSVGVKLSGTFADKPLKVKSGGSFADAVALGVKPF